MHTDHSVQGTISAANRRHDLHPLPVRHQARSSNAARFAAPLAGPREVTVPASTAQCHGHINIKAPELSERPSSASKKLFGALLPKSDAKSVLTMLVLRSMMHCGSLRCVLCCVSMEPQSYIVMFCSWSLKPTSKWSSSMTTADGIKRVSIASLVASFSFS